MKELNLDPGILTVAINGKPFVFRADSAFAERACSLGNEAKRRALLAAAEGRHDPDGTKSFLIRAIDTLLGDGSITSIFGEASPDTLDLLDILDVIMSEFYRYRTERLARVKEGMV